MQGSASAAMRADPEESPPDGDRAEGRPCVWGRSALLLGGYDEASTLLEVASA
jgi:hypothetical protein